MKKITINTIDKNYDIYIGDVLNVLKQYLNPNKKVLIITDHTVKDLHLNTLKKEVNTNYLFSLGINPEKNKDLFTYEACINYCIQHFLDRNLLVLSFGGGAVTDFAGFFASTYKRGVELIHLPTTLLAHDSSVGGKTALNYQSLKNMIGSFYQPSAVIYHLEFLKTLPEREIVSGFGEVFKHDFLSEGYILNALINEETSLKHLIDDNLMMEEIIYHSILIKKVYVEMDIYDRGKRKFLNFGHTIAHGIEILDQYSHGEAVALGMCFDLYISNRSYFKVLYEKLIKLGFFKVKTTFVLEDIINIIRNDKKNENDFIKFIGLEKYGEPYEINLTVHQFSEHWNQFLQVIS